MHSDPAVANEYRNYPTRSVELPNKTKKTIGRDAVQKFSRIYLALQKKICSCKHEQSRAELIPHLLESFFYVTLLEK
jgi:hypothetical protein